MFKTLKGVKSAKTVMGSSSRLANSHGLSQELSKLNRLSVMNSARGFAKMELSGVQMRNPMIVTKKTLDQQVAILENQDIPKALKNSDDYVYRHMGNSDNSTRRMLKLLEVDSIEQLMD